MTFQSKELLDITVVMVASTEKAILVSKLMKEDEKIWLPKSQIEYRVKGKFAEVTLPAWLAIDKGLENE
jgi:LEA14-like dessication related protein